MESKGCIQPFQLLMSACGMCVQEDVTPNELIAEDFSMDLSRFTVCGFTCFFIFLSDS